MRRHLLLGVVALAGCDVTAAPDARLPQPTIADAMVGSPDAPAAAMFDAGGAADASGGPSADAVGADAEAAIPDAAAMADAGVPDAPLPMGPAEVIINELSPDFTGGHDLVELLVTRGGTAAGIQLERDYPRSPVVLAVLPDVIVLEGQIIVVHLAPEGTSAAGETLAVDEKPTAHNFAAAWDFLGTDEHLQYTNVILAVRAADEKVTSVVPFFRPDLAEENDSFPRFFGADLQAVIAAGLWNETCEPAPCTYGSNLAAVTVNWLGAGTTANPNAAAGASVARKPGGVNAGKVSDWQEIPTAAPWKSYGLPN
jgi:hypothetical protein